MREQLSRFRPGPTLKAAAVFAAFLVVFLVVDRLSGPGEPGEGEAVATTETTTAPETTAPPSGGEPPETTAAPGETAPPETTETPETTQPAGDETPPGGGTPPARTDGGEPSDGGTPPEDGDEPGAPLRPAEGVTLQVLNGTGELRLARDFKPLASQEGYEIVNSGNTNSHYPVSTIFFTGGNREDAEAFQARFPAFEIVAPAPDTLSDTVALHAVLGENYEP